MHLAGPIPQRHEAHRPGKAEEQAPGLLAPHGGSVDDQSNDEGPQWAQGVQHARRRTRQPGLGVGEEDGR